jgi:multiple antibiotic resistance protein
MPMDFAASALVTLLVTLDPPGLAPIFLSLTRGMTAAQRRQVAWRACLIALGLMAFFGLAGDLVLTALGVSMPAFRVAGGLLLFWIAFDMVFDRRGASDRATADVAITQDHIRNVAAVPLAIPLMAGPGALTAIMLLAGRASGDLRLTLILVGLTALVIGLVWLVFLLANPIARLLGATGNLVLTRLLGVVLAALAVQFVADGVAALVRAA